MVTVVATAVFMSNLDLWIVNVALVAMGHGLHASLSGLSWVLNAYAVALAALLIPAGRLGDRIGHRQVFLGGIALFTLASAACAAAPDLPVLIAARALQAAGAAAQLPTSLALLIAAFPPERRMSAARGWAAVGALAAVAGPVLGGLLVSLSWRWVFVVNVPVGVAAWLAGRWVLPLLPRQESGPVPDLAGSALLIAAVGSLTGAVVEAPSWGWTSPATLVLLAAAVAAAAGFGWRCQRHPFPMVELPLLRVRRFGTANLATFLFSLAFAIMLLSNSLWCQEVWHYSPLRTGLALVPGPAMVPLVTFASARLVHRFGAGRVSAAGSVLFALSLLWRVGLAGLTPDYARDLLPSMLVGGIGVGLALGTLIAAGATALPGHRSATGSAIINSTRQVASALGVAILVTLLGAVTGVRHSYDAGWLIAAVLAIAAGAAALAIRGEPAAAARSAAPAPAAQTTQPPA